MPTYPFQRRRFWGPDKPKAAHAEYHTAHPLLGQKIPLAGVENEVRYQAHIETDSPAWLPDHEVMGNVVVPGAAYVEMALNVAEANPVVDLTFENPLQVNGRTSLQTVVRAGQEGRKTIETFSSSADGTSWNRNFSAAITDGETGTPER